ncbi:MAG TPA: YkvA family protein [Kofleriaceae bacterium]
MAHIDTFKSWAETIRQDIEAYKALLESKADEHSKKLAGASLLYLVSRMDLIPDWNEGIGVIDDVMILRVNAQLVQGHDLASLPTAGQTALDRMANEAEKISDFLGSALYDKLKAYCAKLADVAVRGRTPAQLVEDAALRKALHVELEDEIKNTVPIVINDAKDAELRLKAYLTHKLQ